MFLSDVCFFFVKDVMHKVLNKGSLVADALFDWGFFFLMFLHVVITFQKNRLQNVELSIPQEISKLRIGVGLMR